MKEILLLSSATPRLCARFPRAETRSRRVVTRIGLGKGIAERLTRSVILQIHFVDSVKADQGDPTSVLCGSAALRERLPRTETRSRRVVRRIGLGKEIAQTTRRVSILQIHFVDSVKADGGNLTSVLCGSAALRERLPRAETRSRRVVRRIGLGKEIAQTTRRVSILQIYLWTRLKPMEEILLLSSAALREIAARRDAEPQSCHSYRIRERDRTNDSPVCHFADLFVDSVKADEGDPTSVLCDSAALREIAARRDAESQSCQAYRIRQGDRANDSPGLHFADLFVDSVKADEGNLTSVLCDSAALRERLPRAETRSRRVVKRIELGKGIAQTTHRSAILQIRFVDSVKADEGDPTSVLCGSARDCRAQRRRVAELSLV